MPGMQQEAAAGAEQHSQQLVGVALTSEPFAARGSSSRSLGSLLMLSPQKAQDSARMSDHSTPAHTQHGQVCIAHGGKVH
jgi:hypothetical protein